jgi:hypothetical protein
LCTTESNSACNNDKESYTEDKKHPFGSRREHHAGIDDPHREDEKNDIDDKAKATMHPEHIRLVLRTKTLTARRCLIPKVTIPAKSELNSS